jgi:DNA-binding protein H-NS
MTKTFHQIQRQIETLQREAEKVKRQEVEGVIARIKEAISLYDLSASDLGLAGGASAPRTAKTAKTAGAARKKHPAIAKFRNEAGETWVGRGPRPLWLRHAIAAGKQLQDFAV